MRDGDGALVHVGHQGLQDVHVNVVQNQHRVSAGVVLNTGFHKHTNIADNNLILQEDLLPNIITCTFIRYKTIII